MKKIQTSILKFLSCSILFFTTGVCDAQNEKIKLADSLFKAKQYTQSLEIYQSVFDQKKYTPGMLLKMAFINEGLGKIGPTLYFLKLYHLATSDEQALKKTAELAAKFKLSGYEEDSSNRMKRWFLNQIIWIQLVLCAGLLLVSIIIFMQRKQNQKPWALLVVLALVMGLQFYVTNYGPSGESAIVTSDKAYLMDGPSAGANVISVIGEGTLLPLLGREDVWLRAKWTDREVYLKEKSVLKVAL